MSGRHALSVDAGAYHDTAWAAAYPTSTPDASAMPQEWKDALNAAVAAGKIPNLAPSTNDPANGPVYAKGLDPMSPDVCSATYKCRLDTDLWDAPDGQVGISFDDGPIPVRVLHNFYRITLSCPFAGKFGYPLPILTRE